jgi:hypothetical protein
VAVASGKSFYPGAFTGYNGYTGFAGFPGAVNPGMLPYGSPFGFPTTGSFINGAPFQGQRIIGKREADSDSDSFYPGYPFVPPTPYGSPYGFGATPFSPYYNPAAMAGAVSPYMRPVTYVSHPMGYNPLLKLEKDEQEIPQVQQVQQRQRRDSDSDSFYPGYPFVAPYGANPYGANPYATPYGAGFYGQPALPSVVPRVLPYNFPGYFGNPVVQTFKPVKAQEEVIEQ